MGLFWIQGGELSEYEFPDASDAEGEVESLTTAFERLKSNYGTADDEDVHGGSLAESISRGALASGSCGLR